MARCHMRHRLCPLFGYLLKIILKSILNDCYLTILVVRVASGARLYYLSRKLSLAQDLLVVDRFALSHLPMLRRGRHECSPGLQVIGAQVVSTAGHARVGLSGAVGCCPHWLQ